MGFELPNGKTARNIQEQVKFLTEKVKELIARVNELELHIEIVDELPETGSSDIIYFVPVEDPEQGNYYNEYMWIDDAWELIGTTQIDLSGYVDLASAQTISGTKSFALSDSQEYKGVITPLPSGFKLGTNVMDGLRFAGYGMYAMSKIVPENNGTLDLGQNDLPWKDIYLSHALYLNDASGTNSGITITPKIDGATITAFSLMLASDYLYTYTVRPYAGDSYDLGGNGQRYRDLYLSRNLTDGSNTVSVAQIASGLGGTYRHVIYIEGATADMNIAVNLNTATPITTQAALAAINENVMGGTATLDTQSTYKIVAIDSVGTVGSITYLDETGQHTLNIVDVYQDVVNQI